MSTDEQYSSIDILVITLTRCVYKKCNVARVLAVFHYPLVCAYRYAGLSCQLPSLPRRELDRHSLVMILGNYLPIILQRSKHYDWGLHSQRGYAYAQDDGRLSRLSGYVPKV